MKQSTYYLIGDDVLTQDAAYARRKAANARVPVLVTHDDCKTYQKLPKEAARG